MRFERRYGERVVCGGTTTREFQFMGEDAVASRDYLPAYEWVELSFRCFHSGDPVSTFGIGIEFGDAVVVLDAGTAKARMRLGFERRGSVLDFFGELDAFASVASNNLIVLGKNRGPNSSRKRLWLPDTGAERKKSTRSCGEPSRRFTRRQGSSTGRIRS